MFIASAPDLLFYIKTCNINIPTLVQAMESLLSYKMSTLTRPKSCCQSQSMQTQSITSMTQTEWTFLIPKRETVELIVMIINSKLF